MKKVDVLVVGAGPAGATVAFEIDNLKTLIVDKFEFPRKKACAGCLLNSLDWKKQFKNFANIYKKLKLENTSRGDIYWRKTLIWSIVTKSLFYQVDREEFDNLLLREALKKPNVSFDKFQVISVKQGYLGNKFGYLVSDGKREIFANFLIGADGAFSCVSRFLGNESLKLGQMGSCLEYDLVCKKKYQHEGHSRISIGFRGEVGYAWIFPSVKGYQVGIGVVHKSTRPIKETLDDYLKWLIEEGLIPEDYEIVNRMGAPIPLRVPWCYAKGNIVLCGDAMGLVKMQSGEGVYFALKSGQIAGRAINQANQLRVKLERIYVPRIRFLRWSVFLTPWIPPKWLVINFFSLVFWFSNFQIFSWIFLPIKHFCTIWAVRRLFLSRKSAYREERWQSYKKSYKRFNSKRKSIARPKDFFSWDFIQK